MKVNDILDNLLINNLNKFERGLINELCISGNLYNKGFSTIVLNDRCPDYDIKVTKDNKLNYIECKLDTMVDKTGNIYLEYWNYTYNRPTGINNSNLNTIYCHTFKYLGEWQYLINYRKNIINTLKLILKELPNKIKPYNHTYYIDGKLVGDKAYIVDVENFLKYYSGKAYKLNFSLRWQ